MNTPTPPISNRYPAPVRRALQQLDAAGVKRSMSAPPLYRLFWRLGWGVAPPILTGFVGNVLTTGAWFAVGWGVAMWLMLWRNTGLTVVGMATIAVIAGLAFGVLMALMLRYQRQRLGLPLWKDLT